ncbi:MAG: glycosyltransferase [Nitrospinae bacterium]|nr:glycosyltransferase [Nitrospinota bacterium]
MVLFEKNFKALASKNPSLAGRVENAADMPHLAVAESRSGLPVPRIGALALHSLYHPEAEGDKFSTLAPANKDATLIVFGFGFGYHLEKIVERPGRIIVIEPSLSIVKSGFERRDLSGLIERVEIVLPEEFALVAQGLNPLKTEWIDHEPSARIFRDERDLLFKPFSVRKYATENRLKIMVVGPVYGGSVPTAVSCARALGQLGFDVDFVDNTPRYPEMTSVELVTPNKSHTATLKKLFSDYLGERIIARADHVRPDMILALAQAPMSPAVIERLKALDIPIIYWFVENHRATPYWKSLAPYYDYFFAMQKGEFLDDLARAGAPYAAYLPQAADPAIHHPARVTETDMEKYGSPLSFMGAGYPNRRKFFAGLLDLPLAVWGTEWDLNTPLGQRVKNANRRMSPEEYVKIFLASGINLNLHSSLSHPGIDPMKDFVNPRTFEIAACGAFQLTDHRSELPEMFRIGEEIEVFQTVEELRDKIAYYLTRPGEREKIAHAGMRRVLREHTFVHRLADMMSAVLPREQERMNRRRGKISSVNDADSIIARAKDEELKKFLAPFAGQGALSLKKVMDRIEKGEGALTKPEIVFMMIDQIFSQG